MKVVVNHRAKWYSNGSRNAAGDAGFHMQSKRENDKHISLLMDEYKKANPVRIVGTAPAAKVAKEKAKALQEQKARAYAIKNEPKRFLPFLARKTNGIAGDKKLRVVDGVKGDARSSWIEYIKTTANGSPVIVGVRTKHGVKDYACPCPWATAESILKSGSIGQDVGRRLFIHRYAINGKGQIVNKKTGKIKKIGRM